MNRPPPGDTLFRNAEAHITTDTVRVGGSTIPTRTIRGAVIAQQTRPNRAWPMLLIGLGPIVGLAIFLGTGWITVGALIGLAIVVVGGLLYRDDGLHEVQAQMDDGETRALYRTRRKRTAEQFVAALARSAALTDLSIDRATGRPPVDG